MTVKIVRTPRYPLHNLISLILKNVCRPYGFIPVKVSSQKDLLICMHHEGLFVIDELCVRKQYSHAFNKQCEVIVDLGAHIGIFSLLCALNVPQKAIILAVEPFSINYKLLLANILINKFNCIIRPMKAVIAPRQGFIDVGWIGYKEGVRAMTMDDVLNLLSKLGYEHVDLLKVDIEGAELDLLTKENSWLLKVRTIVAELHPWIYGFQGVSKIVRELKRYGFKVLIITRNIDSPYALKLFKQSVGLSPQPSYYCYGSSS